MKIVESSLSRLTQWMDEHDCGTLTAFRSEFSKEDNNKRNISLKAKILAKGYGVTIVDGSYIENIGTDKEIEVKEQTFFVVDLKDSGNLEKDLRYWGEEFDQDSILFIPVGGEKSLLYGTTRRKNAQPSYGNFITFENRKFGTKGEFMTKVRGRPFIFESVSEIIYPPTEFFSKWGMFATAKLDWRKL